MQLREYGSTRIRAAEIIAVKPNRACGFFGADHRSLAGQHQFFRKIDPDIQYRLDSYLVVCLKQYAGAADVDGPSVQPMRHAAFAILQGCTYGETLCSSY